MGRLAAGSRLSVERSGRADLVWFAGHRGLVIIDSPPTGPSKLDLDRRETTTRERCAAAEGRVPVAIHVQLKLDANLRGEG